MTTVSSGKVELLYGRYRADLVELHRPAGRCHGLGHALRVAYLSEWIAEREGVRPELAIYAALFHDTGHAAARAAGADDHEERSAEAAQRCLEDVLPPLDLSEVRQAILGRRFSKLHESRSPVGAVLDDADNLDAIGLSGVARVFQWLEEHRISEDSLEAEPRRLASADLERLRGHWAAKLCKLPSLMRTDAGRVLARERSIALVGFIEGLERELHVEGYASEADDAAWIHRG